MEQKAETPVVYLMKNLLAFASVYKLFSFIVGTPKAHKKFATEAIHPTSTDHILEFGCGCGDLVTYLSPSKYVGIDVSENYIRTAMKSYGDKYKFLCARIEDAELAPASFNKVISFGVLHHISDQELDSALKCISDLCKNGGNWCSVDPVFLPNQNWFVRKLIENDRGKYVRTPEQYINIIKKYFPNLKYRIVKDWANIPYDLILIEGDRVC